MKKAFILISALLLISCTPLKEPTPQLATPSPLPPQLYDQTSDLKDITGGQTKATAYRNIPKAGENFKFNVVMINAPTIRENEFWEAWLFKKDQEEFVSAGRLIKTQNGYETTLDTPNIYLEYNYIVVTLEKVEDENPEKHVLEGEFPIL